MMLMLLMMMLMVMMSILQMYPEKEDRSIFNCFFLFCRVLLILTLVIHYAAIIADTIIIASMLETIIALL